MWLENILQRHCHVNMWSNCDWELFCRDTFEGFDELNAGDVNEIPKESERSKPGYWTEALSHGRCRNYHVVWIMLKLSMIQPWYLDVMTRRYLARLIDSEISLCSVGECERLKLKRKDFLWHIPLETSCNLVIINWCSGDMLGVRIQEIHHSLESRPLAYPWLMSLLVKNISI